MSATDHLQPSQLSMFMTGEELYAGHLGDVQGAQTTANKDATLNKKRKRMAGMFTRAHEHMDEPVVMWHRTNHEGPMLEEGHHRLAHRLDTDPKGYLAVEHHGVEGLNPKGRYWWEL